MTTTLKTLFQVNQRFVKFTLAKLFTIPHRLRRNHGNFCISSLCPYALGTEQCKPTPYVSLSWCNSNKDTFLVHEYRISMNVPTVGLPHGVNHRSHFYQTWLQQLSGKFSWILYYVKCITCVYTYTHIPHHPLICHLFVTLVLHVRMLVIFHTVIFM